MPDFSQVLNYPDINFVDTSVDDMISAAISTYQQTYLELTGQAVVVQPGDDVYIMLYSNALKNYSILQSINYAARQNFLKYATDASLDNLAANTGNERDDPGYAVCTEQFNLGVAQPQDITIPKGTRVTPGNNLYFATDEDAQIPAGAMSVTVPITCLTSGSTGNGYIAGQINTLVDPVPFIASVSNIDTTDGGTDLESDSSLAEKVFSANQGYSVAGPSGAYDYFARKFSSAVIDTAPVRTSPGSVCIYVLLTGGTMPNETFLNNLLAYIGADNRRPLTDNLSVSAPAAVNYNIDLTYYIDPDDAAQSATIQAAVTQAVNNFVLWTQSKIARDINPDELTKLIRIAGAKRAPISSPAYTPVPDASIAVVGSINITNGGVDNG